MATSVLVYATTEDLANWTGEEAPANATPLLRSASILVRGATRAALYDTDAAGKPSDTEVLQAFSDATCSQAAAWGAAGIDPTEQGVGLAAPAVVSKSMGGRSVQYADLSGSVTIQQARAQAATQLCAEALAILAGAGLLSGQPGVGYATRRSILDA